MVQAIAGKGSKAADATGNIENVVSWDGSFEPEELDSTVMGNAAGAEIPGIQKVSFTLTFNRDPTATAQNRIIDAALAGTEITMKLYEDATHNFSGKYIPKYKGTSTVKGILVGTITGNVSDGNLWTRT